MRYSELAGRSFRRIASSDDDRKRLIETQPVASLMDASPPSVSVVRGP